MPRHPTPPLSDGVLQSGLTRTVPLPERFRGCCPFGAAGRYGDRLSRARVTTSLDGTSPGRGDSRRRGALAPALGQLVV